MSFTDLEYSNTKMEDLWAEIEGILREQGSLHNYELVKKINYAKYGWSEETTLRILTDLRKEREAEGEIHVREETGEGSQPRQLWVLPE